jgi:hypothetical protein
MPEGGGSRRGGGKPEDEGKLKGKGSRMVVGGSRRVGVSRRVGGSPGVISRRIPGRCYVRLETEGSRARGLLIVKNHQTLDFGA